jgi:hypothetical protein
MRRRPAGPIAAPTVSMLLPQHSVTGKLVGAGACLGNRSSLLIRKTLRDRETIGCNEVFQEA